MNMIKEVTFTMRKEVENFIDKHDLIPQGSIIAVGVSGGPDSIALLNFLYNLKEKRDLSLIALHVDHMFRGKESEQDFRYVKDFCNRLNIPFEGTQIQVSLYQKERGLSPQVAARECRYQFFEHMMKKYNASLLALGHHGDDQIETMLMRMVRGSTGGGLAGIPSKRQFAKGTIIRPFLSITKKEIEQYCEENQLLPRYDPSNEKNTYVRNRFRHHVLPFIKGENHKAHERFQYLSETIKDDDLFLLQLTEQEMQKVIKVRNEKEVIFSISNLHTLPISLQRRGIHLILKYLYRNNIPFLSSLHIENLLSFLNDEHPSGQLNYPNDLLIIKSYQDCIITFSKKKEEEYHYLLHIPGNVSLEGRFSLSAKWLPVAKEHEKKSITCILNAKLIKLPLSVRSRRPGDRMEIKGLNGSKKIKDIFIDHKVPIQDRNWWPIIEDADGQILWLPGLKESPHSIIHAKEDDCILLTFTTD